MVLPSHHTTRRRDRPARGSGARGAPQDRRAAGLRAGAIPHHLGDRLAGHERARRGRGTTPRGGHRRAQRHRLVGDLGVRGRPAVIELVGPAGVGKTTLSQQLEASAQGVRVTIWVMPIARLARSTLRQVPTAFALYRETGRFLWDEVKHLARLDALHTLLRAPRWQGTPM